MPKFFDIRTFSIQIKIINEDKLTDRECHQLPLHIKLKNQETDINLLIIINLSFKV